MTVTRIESNTNIATLRLLNTHTHQTKHTKKPTTIRKITYKPYTNLHKISESIKRKDFL